MRGIALGLYPGARNRPMERRLTEITSAIDEIALAGANYIALITTWAQRDVYAVDIAPSDATIEDDLVRRAAAHAHARGLNVVIFPILTVEQRSQGQWRGTIQPRDVDVWWQAYERFIVHYADIARATSARALMIGSELGSTEAWRDRWYHLISRVEGRYRGRLLYSANWDHYHLVSFWPRLDAIGVTGYFELTRDRNASEDVLQEAWQRIREQLLQFAKARHKPLIITEVGYTSVDGTATRPWDYGMRGPIDHEEQRRAYSAFVAAWRGTAALQGVFFWNWYGTGGDDDRGYTPKDKPAGRVLKSWFRGR